MNLIGLRFAEAVATATDLMERGRPFSACLRLVEFGKEHKGPALELLLQAEDDENHVIELINARVRERGKAIDTQIRQHIQAGQFDACAATVRIALSDDPNTFETPVYIWSNMFISIAFPMLCRGMYERAHRVCDIIGIVGGSMIGARERIERRIIQLQTGVTTVERYQAFFSLVRRSAACCRRCEIQEAREAFRLARALGYEEFASDIPEQWGSMINHLVIVKANTEAMEELASARQAYPIDHPDRATLDKYTGHHTI